MPEEAPDIQAIYKEFFELTYELEKPATTRIRKQQIRIKLQELRKELGLPSPALKIDQVTDFSPLHSYCGLLRPAHLEYWKKLGQVFYLNQDSQLLRRSYYAAAYGICVSEMLKNPFLESLQKYFPTFRLPFNNPSGAFLNLPESYRGISCRAILIKHVEDFKWNRMAEPEDHLRVGLLAPLITDVISFFKSNDPRFNIAPVNEFNMNFVDRFPFRRYVDFAGIIEDDGLPILLVEMAEEEVPSGFLHKDFRKMTVMMASVLMSLVKRGLQHFSNSDVSKFRIYGILIGKYQFDYCVGTVVKEERDRIGFVFHSSDMYWRYNLYGPDRELSEVDLFKKDQYICNDNVSTLRDAIETGSDLLTDEMIDQPWPQSATTFVFSENEEGVLLNTEAEVAITTTPRVPKRARLDANEGRDPNPNHRGNININSLGILCQFIKDMKDYYVNLSDCLRSCYVREFNYITTPTDRYKFPTEAFIPPLATSASTHIGKSGQKPFTSVSQPISQDPGVRSVMLDKEVFIYPTLPDVIRIELRNQGRLEEDTLYAREHMFIENFKIIHLNPSLIANYPFLTYLALSKFIMDLLLATHRIHSKGLVLGSIDPDNIHFDGAWWRLLLVPHMTTVQGGSVPNFARNLSKKFHIRANWTSSTLSQRDDLYGIGALFFASFRAYLENSKRPSLQVPEFEEFVQVTANKMINVQEFPNITSGSILKDCWIKYKQLIEEFEEFLSVGDQFTYLLVGDVRRDLESKPERLQGSQSSSASSVETVPISLSDTITTSESEKDYE